MQASSRFSEPGLSEKQNCLSFMGRKFTASFGLWSNELVLLSTDEEYIKKMEEAKSKRFSDQQLLAPSVPEIADFLNAVIHDKKLTIPEEGGRKSVEFVVATFESALIGKPVKIPIEASDSMYASTERPVSA